MIKHLLLLNLFIAITCFAEAQGLRGKITDMKGEALPYTSIYVQELKTGTSSNLEGVFELPLAPGKYTIRFQYIGYTTVNKEVEIGNTWQELNITLAEQGLVLNEIIVRSTKEDAAYTIMRKAIAKAKYHTLQYDSLTVLAYVKGTGIIEGLPFLLRNTLEKEGLKKDEAYTSESVSKITLKQPNTQIEEVISIRSAGQGFDGASPTPFILTSFYERGTTAISPLDTRAFAYYRFEYLGSFDDGDYVVNKIKVTPRSRGEQVWEGEIYIIEDLWAIHSLDLFAYYLGFRVDVQQNFAEILPKVWLPVTQNIVFSGSFLGFKGRYEYVVAMREYEVHLNELLMRLDTEIIDEKIEEVPVEIRKADPKIVDEALPDNPEEMTRRQFRRMMNDYEKEQIKAQEEPRMTSVRVTKIDTLARRRDSLYWETIRPIPLSQREVAGYKRDDSVAVIQQVELSGVDTLRVLPRRKFKPMEVFTGGSYRTGPKGRVFFDNNLLKTQFNTVEGFNANMGFGYVHRYDSLRRAITVRSDLRYGLASNQFYGTGTLRYSRRGTRTRPTFVAELRGGTYVEQFSTQFNSIEPIINTFSSLLYRQNFMKIYEKQFGLLNLRWNKGDRWRIQSTLEYAQRNPLQNNTDFSIYNRGDRAYTSNDPLNLHGDASFDPHQALISTVNASYKPFSTFYMRNGRRYESFARSPELRMMYRKGFDGPFGADAAFDHLELGVAHDFQLGIRGRIDFQVKAGSFFGSNPAYFMDFAHFAGNRTVLTSLNPSGAYRLLDFYLYSTSGEYVSFLGHYQFRKLLFTQLPKLRVSGLRENVFLNYLKTDVSPHYVEVGYGVDNIFRLFRVEFATSFEDLKYQEFGYRIGVATIINISRE